MVYKNPQTNPTKYYYNLQFPEKKEEESEQSIQEDRQTGQLNVAKVQMANNYVDSILLKLNPDKNIIVEAVNHYNKQYLADGKCININNQLTDHFRNRIVVNYLKHKVLEYDKKLEGIWGMTSIEAYIALNRKIYIAIAEAYPDLQDECKRQLSEKLEKVNGKRTW